jgi:hypothetical protein
MRPRSRDCRSKARSQNQRHGIRCVTGETTSYRAITLDEARTTPAAASDSAAIGVARRKNCLHQKYEKTASMHASSAPLPPNHTCLRSSAEEDSVCFEPSLIRFLRTSPQVNLRQRCDFRRADPSFTDGYVQFSYENVPRGQTPVSTE